MGMQNKADERKAMFDAFKAQQGSIDSANNYASQNNGFAFTRRIIALSVTAIVVLVAVAPMMQPVNVLQEIQTGGSYLFGLIDTTKVEQKWVQLEGSVVLPVVVPSFQAIIGAYFGASIAGSK
jgi:lipopolysaccharide/colanic/teichoic acid biosynthesis glycosyltransferase